MDARVKTDLQLDAVDPNAPLTPPLAPLSMPQQGIAAAAMPLAGEPDLRWRLSVVIIPALVVASFASGQAWRAFSIDGMSPLEWVALLLLAANIAWITLAGATAVAGAVLLAGRKPVSPAAHATPLATTSLTAIVFPIRNEEPARVTAAAQAIHDSLARAHSARAFEFFFLSDTNDEAVALEEQDAIERLRATRPDATIFYRRRDNNHGRKAGNIADFVRRWGGRYDYMAVMDADSLMSARALTELVRRMDDAPRTALIQTVPMLVSAQTMIARSQQFAMRAYGQIFGEGLAWWSGGAGNFWGHNAIIRVRAFASHAGLPVLPGKGPLAGHILSHDFVEAAMLRRAGWRVQIAPEIVGSYEESPPTMEDMSARDRRWAQGNLQHLKLIGAPGFDPASRAHLLCGVMGYVSSLLWFSLIIVGALQAWAGAAGLHASATPGGSLLLITGVIVLAPKWLAFLLWTAGRLPGWGRSPGFVAGLAVETAMSAATAPIMMVNQARAVIAPFLGRDAGWRPQARVATRSGGASQYRLQMMFGLALCATMAVNAGFAAWTLPVAASLVFAAPIAWAFAYAPPRRSWLWRTLATPEDLRPPTIVSAARRAANRLAWATANGSAAKTQPGASLIPANGLSAVGAAKDAKAGSIAA
jgi:membrane glycosyltransferase